jgi:hypothetical protein
MNHVTLEINPMFNNFVYGFSLAAALVAGTASANEPHHALPQLAGVTTDLGNNSSALTYWVNEADGIHVVTTIDTVAGDKAVPEQERHAVVRFSALILPGQSQEISVPGPTGSQQQSLLIRTLGNQPGNYRVEVERIPSSEARAQAVPVAPAE